MRIKPTESNFRSWIKCVPQGGDLLFFGPKALDLVTGLSVPMLTVEEIKAQVLNHWTLNQRSWYAYALNRASHACWLPVGRIESIDPRLRAKIARLQSDLEVPTLIAESVLSENLKSRLLKVERRYWLTSSVWMGLRSADRIAVIKAWYVQNEISEYESSAASELPAQAFAEMKRIGFDSLLNKYPDVSGPNCFAAVAGAIASHRGSSIAEQWLHWGPLARFLSASGYVRTKAKGPLPGDVLTFSHGKQVVHAAYFIGEGFYFEKPGQDFYEPYRVARFENWNREWPDAALTVWRRAK